MMFLAAIDTTILSTAMPRIVNLLGYPELYHWAFTAFMLTSTLALPFYGRLADRIGIRTCMLIAGTVFLLGSALCTVAGHMYVLIAGRALQGLGASGLQGLPLIAFGLLYPPEQRGAKQSLISMVWGFSSLAGPVTGGYLVTYFSWRWVFGFNLPLGLFALLIFWWRFPRQHVRPPRGRLDGLSAGLLLSGLSSLILLSAMDATSFQSLGYGASAVLIALFIWRQRHAPDPLIPLAPFARPVYQLACLLGVSSSFVGFAALTYVPYYLQEVLGFAPERTGLVLTPMMLAWPISSAVAGFQLNRLGFRTLVIIGSFSLCVSMAAWTAMACGLELPLLELWCIALGIGMGCLTPPVLVAAQTVVPLAQMGVASSTLVLLRNIGSTLGVSLMGALQVQFQAALGQQLALGWVFACLLIFSLLTLISALLMPAQTPQQLSQSSAAP